MKGPSDVFWGLAGFALIILALLGGAALLAWASS